MVVYCLKVQAFVQIKLNVAAINYTDIRTTADNAAYTSETVANEDGGVRKGYDSDPGGFSNQNQIQIWLLQSKFHKTAHLRLNKVTF